MDRLRGTFGRQVLPMIWDYAETNPFAGAGGDIYGTAHSLCEVLENLSSPIHGFASQADAAVQTISNGKLVYVAQARMGIKAHSFDITTNDIKVVIGPDSLGSFTIKTQDKKDNNYVMIPKSRVPADGGVIVTLLNRNLTVR